ncbi:MAG: CPBP family intramembrane metalloprotease [Holophagales bacterium]|jgi:membrane protease YdiL (CAAX protease family)|nr:CPBP family intramembrane metalloprotease [Holophagales bacterium]
MNDSEPGVPTEPVPTRADAARNGLLVFFAVVALGSGVFQGLLLRSGKPIGESPGLVYGLMWTPAVASLVARLVFREGFRDVSFRLGGRAGWRAIGFAWLLPPVFGAVVYGLAWMTGLASFGVPALADVGLSALGQAARLATLLGITLTLGSVVSLVSAAGEEIGWRGYLLTRLIEAEVPRPVLVSSLVWALWHVPLVVSGQYAAGPNRILSAAVFVVTVVGIGFTMAYLRLTTGSVWPAVVLHGVWNAVIQGAFDVSTKAPSIWVGEAGILVAAASLAVAWALVRKGFAARRAPGEEPFATVPGLSG